MKRSTSGLGLSLLVDSRHDCLNSWLIPKSNRIDYKIIVLLIYLVVYLKPFRLSESCFYTSGKNHVPLILKRKCNYFWQINHSNSVCLSNLSALIAKFSASFMYFNYIRTFPDIQNHFSCFISLFFMLKVFFSMAPSKQTPPRFSLSFNKYQLAKSIATVGEGRRENSKLGKFESDTS